MSEVEAVTDEEASHDQARWISFWTRISKDNHGPWQNQPEDLRTMWKEDGSRQTWTLPGV
jgi:hypothetical protein